MLSCVSNRIEKEYLKQANQIKVRQNDYKEIYDLMGNYYPNKQVILSITEPLTDKQLNVIKHTPNLMLELPFYHNDFLQLNRPFYMAQPAHSFQEVNGFAAIGASQFLLGSPLFFRIGEVAELNMPTRIIPHKAFIEPIHTPNSLHGQWMRPEDINLYDEILKDKMILDFSDAEKTKQQALFRLYVLRQPWNGDLNTLIEDLNLPQPLLNRMLNSKITEVRLNCGQRCENPSGTCTICDRTYYLAQKLTAK